MDEDIVKRLRDAEPCLTAGTLGERCRSMEAKAGCCCAAAADEIERLRAEREWQPIETAPKDATEVLLGALGSGDLDFYRWVDGIGWADRFSDPPYEEPTHWMQIDPPACDSANPAGEP